MAFMCVLAHNMVITINLKAEASFGELDQNGLKTRRCQSAGLWCFGGIRWDFYSGTGF